MKWADIFHSEASGWTVLVRLSVGLIVFLPEGIQKLVFPDILGAGRFAKSAFPSPK
jgi:putative oxidoreductase